MSLEGEQLLSMALQLVRASRSVEEVIFKNVVSFLMEVVEPLVASPFRMFVNWRRGITLTALTEFTYHNERSFHHGTSLLRKRNRESQIENTYFSEAAGKILQLRQSNGTRDALARIIGDRLTPEFVLEMVKSLKHDPDTAFFFFRWAGDQESYEHDARVYNQVIRVLASINRLEDVKTVLEEMMEKDFSLEFDPAVHLVVCYANAGMVERAQELFVELRRQRGVFSAHVYNSLFIALEKQHRYEDVYRTVIELTAEGFVPSESTADVIVRVFCKGNAVKKAVWFLNWMTSKGLQVHSMAFSMVIDSLCKVGKEDVALRLFEDAATTPGRTESDKAFICCSLVCGIFRTGELLKASQMIRMLAHRGLMNSCSDSFPEGAQILSYVQMIKLLRRMKVGLSTFEYNCFIEGLCKAGMLDDAQQLYDLMRANEIPADVFTYNYMIECISKAGRVEDAQKVLEAMEQSECKPDMFTYTRIINGFCRIGKMENALELLSRMKDAGCSPDVVTFDCIINGLCKASNFEAALTVLKISIEAGCEPDEVTYSSIIDPLCRQEEWESALKVFALAKQRNCPGSARLYSRLMNCLCKTGQVGAACQLLQDLSNGEVNSDYILGGKTCEPDVVIYSIVVDGLCSAGKLEEAFVVVKVMEAQGVKADVFTYTSFLKAFCSNGRLEEAFKLLEMMVKSGCSPDVVAYNTLIASLCSAGRVEEACGLLEVMVSNGCEPNELTLGQLIMVLCRAKKLEAAMHLLNYMKLGNCIPQFNTYKELIYCYCRLGRQREARKFLENESKTFSMNNPGLSLLSEIHESASFQERKQLSSLALE